MYLIASSWVVVKILLIVVVIAIVAGLYWLLRRSVLRDEQASRQRLKRGIEAWRAGGGVSPPSGFRGDDYSGFYNTGGYSAWSGGGSDDGGGKLNELERHQVNCQPLGRAIASGSDSVSATRARMAL